jgi:hypothetical protein
MEKIFHILSNAFTIFAFSDFISAFLGKLRVKRKWSVFSYIAFFIISTYIHFFLNVPIINIVSNIVCLLLISLLYNARNYKRITTVFLVFVIGAFWDGVLYNFSSQLGYGQHLFISSGLATAIMFYSTDVCLKKFFKHPKENKISLKAKHYIPLFSVPIFSLIIGYFTIVDFNKISVLMSIFLLSNNIMIFYLYDNILKSYSEKYEQKILENSIDSYKGALKLLENSQNKIKFLHHDMKNHLLSIKTLLHKEETAQAINYIDNSLEFVALQKLFPSIGNQFIDGILNNKFSSVVDKGVQVSVTGKIAENIPVDSFDLSVILGNLIDNAITATLNTKEKTVNLKIQQHQALISIVIDNSFDPNKQNLSGQGLGLKSVAHIISKYNGIKEITQENNTFTVKIILYIPE